MALTGNVSYGFDVTDPQTVAGVEVTYNPKLSDSIRFTDGTGAKKAEDVGAYKVTLAGSAVDVGMITSFEDLNGTALVFTSVKGLVLQAPADNAGNVTVGADVTQPWDDLLNAAGTLTLPPGSWIAMGCNANGVAVTAGDSLQVDGTSGDVVNIRVLGEVA